MMRHGLSRAAVVTPQEILPEFTRLEQALVEKLKVVQRDLNNTLNEISAKDHIEISPSARNEIRRILFDTQRALGTIAKNHVHSKKCSNFYRDVNQFVTLVDEMETMFCQTLKNCALKKEESEEDRLSLESVSSHSDSLAKKTAQELFDEFSADDKKNLLADQSDMIRQIERTGYLSSVIYESSRLVNRNSEEPAFLTRFFDARRIVSEAIEKIHRVIHHRDEPGSQNESRVDTMAQGARRRERVTAIAPEKEYCYHFGLIPLCSEIKKQMRELLVKNNQAQAKRINILKMICSLAHKEPDSSPATDSSSSCSSSESSNSSVSNKSSSISTSSSTSNDDSSRASSLASSGLFSRSRSPSPTNPNQPSSGARPG